MIDTKLILIEGLPCSGKSSTAKELKSAISSRGIACQCFLEWAPDNPIFIGDIDNLAEIIATTKSREQGVLRDWRKFMENAKRRAAVTILESRLWQTDAMYLYLSGHSEYEVAESSRRIVRIISDLNPVLIYLTPEDIQQALAQVTEAKNQDWRKAGKEGSWEQWGNDVYDRQHWFTSRSLKCEDAAVRFFNEWASIADRLYEEVPFRKIKVLNPQANWETTLHRIKDFLSLEK
jgi:thymidylate kinase